MSMGLTRTLVAAAFTVIASQASAGVISIDQISVPATAAAQYAVPQARRGVSITQLLQADGAAALFRPAAAAENAASLIVQPELAIRNGLTAEVWQSAPGSVSEILQDGSFNTALVLQTANAAGISRIVQAGVGNSAFVWQ